MYSRIFLPTTEAAPFEHDAPQVCISSQRGILQRVTNVSGIGALQVSRNQACLLARDADDQLCGSKGAFWPLTNDKDMAVRAPGWLPLPKTIVITPFESVRRF